MTPKSFLSKIKVQITTTLSRYTENGNVKVPCSLLICVNPVAEFVRFVDCKLRV